MVLKHEAQIGKSTYPNLDGKEMFIDFLLKALSVDPPRLNFRYQPLVDRISSLCEGVSPSGSSITNACFHTANIANDSANDNVVEWDGDNDVSDISGSLFFYFIFVGPRLGGWLTKATADLASLRSKWRLSPGIIHAKRSRRTDCGEQLSSAVITQHECPLLADSDGPDRHRLSASH